MWTTRLLQLGQFRLDAGAMFGMIPRVVWMKWFPQGTIDDANRMPLGQNSLLLENNGKLVIVEVGIGDKLAPKERDLYAQSDQGIHHALHQIDCRPEDISAVIVTHLHFDHAGGLTRTGSGGHAGEAVLTFPNAEIICQRQEWHDAIENKSTMHKTYLRDHLTPDVAARLRAVDGDVEVLPGIHVVRMPGHTWGQQGVVVDGVGGKKICFVPDVLPTALHFRPTTNMAYDVEPYISMIERTKLLERANRENWTLVLDHEPGHPVFIAVPDPKTGHHTLAPASL